MFYLSNYEHELKLFFAIEFFAIRAFLADLLSRTELQNNRYFIVLCENSYPNKYLIGVRSFKGFASTLTGALYWKKRLV